MIGVVVVSHSRALARAVRDLALEMCTGGTSPVVELASGLDEGTTGTDAALVAEVVAAVDIATGGDGVLILVDLGSAVLSAEMALELLDPGVAARVRVSPAPLVEGLLAAVVAAGTGADLDTCALEAERGLAAKVEHLGAGAREDRPARDSAGDAQETAVAEDARPWVSTELAVVGEHGLHARPAARLVTLVGRAKPGTEVRLTNVTIGHGPVDARSLSAVGTLGARQGHVLLAQARGAGAEQLLADLEELAASAFGDHAGPVEPLSELELPVPAAVSSEPGVAGSGLDAALGPAIIGERPLSPGMDPGEDPGPEGRSPAEPEERIRQLERAIAQATGRLAALEEHARRHLGYGEAEVFAAHAILLRDPALQADVRARIRAGATAVTAWCGAVEMVAARFDALPDSYQRERAQDVRSIGDRVVRILLDHHEPESLGEGVLVVDELDPGLAISLDAHSVKGVLTRRGGGLGHGVLIARARGVPVLTGVGSRADVPPGTLLAFDARSGRVDVDPPPEVQTAFEAMLERRRKRRERALADTHLPVTTRDGLRITVKANVSSLAVARLGAGLGAEGSGLVRTEAVFARSRTAPTVEQQQEVYGAIAAAYHPHPVTIRTWDVGGDKPLDFLPSWPEANPFLGERGIRAFREDPTVLIDQLEAICRVAQEHRVNVLFPMVSSLDDVDWARERLAEAAARAGLPGLPDRLGVGLMVEVPAVAVRLGRLAQGLDFISIGSNDLSQYTLAAERGNPRLERWSDPLDPAVLQLIRFICERAPEGVVVSLCGEMAADPDVARLLVGLGVRELSSTAAAVPAVKAVLRETSLEQLRELAAGALAARDAGAVRELLHQ
ncbi:phosphoenolpyruvate--protein phosphotransferase [Ornithinimicrobium pratense]|uniref:Phosphocarrier protein HPr n=1 Tax=Ornithinimicrobium pratense TaxID=2593973 RepID=A0A5J6V734_9MICO|nr:phosphoenolpyruvate--protein phosphotransferase [Ornithinimicrobium pratense]QFG68883.1 phosphoenolpyruvate--protein phosphotransferase [Ornithinimicrobium pratense]